MASFSAGFFLPEESRIMEEIYLLQTLKLFSERYGQSSEEIFGRYTMMEENMKKKIKNLKERIERARKRGLEGHVVFLTKELNDIICKASKLYSTDAIMKALLPWVEQSSFKTVYEKLGFVIELPPIKGYDKTWKISTIHSYSYGLAPPDENTRLGKLSKKIGLTPFVEKRVQASHYGDLEQMLIMEKNGVFYAREGSTHGFYSHWDKKLGEYDSLEEIFNDWTFNFYPGDHSPRIMSNKKIKKKIRGKIEGKIEKLLNKTRKFFKRNEKKDYRKVIKMVPINKRKEIRPILKQSTEKDLENIASEVFDTVTPKFEIIDYETVKEIFGFKPHYDFISDVFKLNDLMEKNLTKQEYNECKKLLWGTSPENFKDIKKDLISFSDKPEIKKETRKKIKETIKKIYTLRAELKTNISDCLNDCLEEPKKIDELFCDTYKDLPSTAKLSLVYSIEQLVHRPLWDVYREKKSFKQRFVYSFLGGYVWVKWFYKFIRGYNKHFKYYKSLNPLYKYYKYYKSLKKSHESLLFLSLLGIYAIGRPIHKAMGYDKKLFKYYNNFYKRTEYLTYNDCLKTKYNNCIKHYKPAEILHNSRFYKFLRKLFKKTNSKI